MQTETTAAPPIRHDRFLVHPGDRLWLWLARRLPGRLRYWVVVHSWAEATAGPRRGGAAGPAGPAATLTAGDLVALLDE